MSDLISREDAIEAIEQLWDWQTVDGIQTSTALRQVIRDIKNIPSAQRKGEWIPCSEMLPNKHTDVLTYCEEADLIEIQSLESFYDEDNRIDELHWENQTGYWQNFYEVIAWMPLPEPYKDGDTE